MMTHPERILCPAESQLDERSQALRPMRLEDFNGQPKVVENLRMFIEAAKSRGEALDHILLHGPPGLGKTTLSQIVAQELGVGFRATSGPLITKAGDLAALLTNLQPRDVLFIDEIHRLSPAVEEVLYPAMEDGHLDILIGEGPAARSIRIDLAPFTLVGATTRSGLLTTPLRERFGIPLRLDFYDHDELQKIIIRGAHLLSFPLHPSGALEIAKRSRGTPRIAMRLLRRVRDIAAVKKATLIDASVVDAALLALEVDPSGLDSMDHKYLRSIYDFYQGGPVGLDTLSALLSEQRDVIEDVIEPYLIQQGFIQRTPRGRVLAHKAYAYFSWDIPQGSQRQDEEMSQDV